MTIFAGDKLSPISDGISSSEQLADESFAFMCVYHFPKSNQLHEHLLQLNICCLHQLVHMLVNELVEIACNIILVGEISAMIDWQNPR